MQTLSVREMRNQLGKLDELLARAQPLQQVPQRFPVEGILTGRKINAVYRSVRHLESRSYGGPVEDIALDDLDSSLRAQALELRRIAHEGANLVAGPHQHLDAGQAERSGGSGYGDVHCLQTYNASAGMAMNRCRVGRATGLATPAGLGSCQGDADCLAQTVRNWIGAPSLG